MKSIIIFLSLCVSVSGWGLLPPPPLVALKKSKSLCKKCLLPPPPLVALKKSKKLICKKKKNNLKKKLILGGAAAAGLGLGGVVAVGGAAVALNQLNNGVVYEPEPGSMDGQVVLITGAASGLGLESAKRLAAAGATVVLTSRTKSKGEQAVEDVKTYLGDKGMDDDAKLYSLELDLDDLGQVKKFPESFKELGLGDVSILMNNAGVMAIPQKELTKDGFERQFQSNVLGHFALTASMFPYLSRGGAKVINVASSAANFAALGLDIDNLNGERSYSAWPSYGQSKLANILFTNELQKRADAAGLDWLTTVSLHPGVVNTDLSRYIVGEDKFQELKESDSFSIESLASRATSLFTKSPEQGANNQVFLAAGADGKLVKGAYYDDMKVKDKAGFMKDEDKAASLWEISEEYAGLTFDLTGLDKAVDDEVVEEAIEEAVIAVLEESIEVLEESVEEAAEAGTSEDDSSEESTSEATEENEADEESDALAEGESSEEKESESDDSSN